MQNPDVLQTEIIQTQRLAINLRRTTGRAGEPLLLLHGNASSSLWLQPLAQALAADIPCIAPDLRGYGDTEAKVIDATRGVDDLVEDLFGLLDALAVDKCHLLGWSLGAAVALRAAILAPARLASLILAAPVSPFGFGGSVGLDGQPYADDYAGSGGGMVNPAFAEAVAGKQLGANSPGSVQHIVRYTVLGRFGETQAHTDEAALLATLFKQQTGDKAWPGDHRPSDHWPYFAPGDYGPLNAISPRHFTVQPLVELSPKPPILYLQGSADCIISDCSLFDPCTLGMLGLIPGWQGQSPQPMVSQMQHFLQRYQTAGGRVNSQLLPGCGHGLVLEQSRQLAEIITKFINQ